MFGALKSGEVRSAFTEIKGGLVILVGLSAVLNVLLLGGSIYMMMVYDSVLPSRSIPTLLSLLLLVLIVYFFQAVFEIFRSRILADMAASLTSRISPRVQQAISFMALRGVTSQGGDGLSPMRDLDSIRQFISGPGPTAFMDLPWVLFFLIVLTLLHPWLGFTALVGVIVMVALTALSARVSKPPTETVIALSGQRYGMADETRRHVELVRALGMGQRLNARWNALNQRLLDAQDKLTDNTATLGGISRVFRMFLQSLVLTVGALLVIDDKASGGVIFASSILAARALAPIDQVVGQWKSFAGAKAALVRLESTLAVVPRAGDSKLQLPPPVNNLSVEGLVSAPPGSKRVTVQDISFRLKAGDALGIIGMSAAGKSSLVRTILGVWQPLRGSVRLDGADIAQWNPEELGRHFGYVPQAVELLPGTVAENIARFADPIDSEAVLKAAKAAGVHDMIVQLPEGYDTQVGRDGEQLSAGQRQWIALARALYGDPFLVVLDEPNSNLDAAGEAALDGAIQSVKSRGGIVIIVAHRHAATARVSHMLVMRDGRIERFGTRDEVIAAMQQPAVPTEKSEPAVRANNLQVKS